MVDAAFAPGQPCYDHEEEELKRLLVEEIAGEVKPSRLDRAINELRPDSERLSENELILENSFNLIVIIPDPVLT